MNLCTLLKQMHEFRYSDGLMSSHIKKIFERVNPQLAIIDPKSTRPIANLLFYLSSLNDPDLSTVVESLACRDLRTLL